ncbi:2-succinyl-5-enolpyruvyl-6-hydroxy-3-cyclohexene-1-carboxylic-acid synthase [Virgibacillus sp. AGTR]|uniref:2-succinyl-5-enolpyruvyl-6-hydroxy-3-cyclohexene-1-carboxylate synthase n=1 Tax=Virgibacillus salarius TaxID=447199 RepID=A0A941DSF9_9BACI|nr:MULTISPECIES: 2-succinyl-5-enolpyruvyl-6-hydroxy-3-cyclohexene-1-carboxylic-acid synthase [Bacillaceae]NAZ07284.1 2-succinyl-5-enolpyruvyl-6-hydroxy-3-cyclohexene-1-carboxylic-acid synthase [Agaribacter marinus]MBR7794562.1 2-succinyl-5-enolpyruvyl-6-hydroxy-3-cyclohexene-1-carboxylic-acid synthase [Virgibacillus salarius]MCC2249449.1 2-succinyl-5-enolpyruvyl-6-hydroxy-3-cyclohexene-1-carboxylic-acid synthase [Virgibacillus sp. AGTR]MDY7043353.1 2-succinyl-5-enolpyruvyl-6-hydroxy-3-cyclohexe
MNHTETLTRYTANFIDELANNGLTDAVISPGSRSTPLALTLAEHKQIKEWIIIDERSAAFYALGIAKKTMRPVALVCTSGTAAANYYPAIVEAFYSRVPLIILTADRPHELRDVGAPQAIAQLNLYGEYVKWFQEMALPESTPEMLLYARNKAARAFFMAKEGNCGPVHLNFPFREPLVVDFQLDNLWGDTCNTPYLPTYDGKKQLSPTQIDQMHEKLKQKKKGIIVCGPQTDPKLGEVVTKLAAKWQVPVLADPLSQVRSGEHAKDVVIDGYDAFLRNETIRELLKPEFIIRIGAMPVSKAYLFYVKQHKDILQFVVENDRGFREPAGNRTEFVFADSVLFCEHLTANTELKLDKDWLYEWQQTNQITKKHLLRKTNNQVTEGEAMRGLLDVIPDNSSIFVGNSMAVRDLDTFFLTTEKRIQVLANRGANGIDGVVSSGLGAASNGSRLTLVLGDLSFFHDMNGLHAAMHYKLDVTILLMNNNGGGIFSFLPQANDRKHFEALFGTPLNINFEHVVTMYGGRYFNPQTEKEVKEALLQSYANMGLSIIEVKTDREENAAWHREKWQAIEAELLKGGA